MQKDAVMKTLDPNFLQIFQQMQTETHKKACKALFEATAEDLNKTYRCIDSVSTSTAADMSANLGDHG